MSPDSPATAIAVLPQNNSVADKTVLQRIVSFSTCKRLLMLHVKLDNTPKFRVK